MRSRLIIGFFAVLGAACAPLERPHNFRDWLESVRGQARDVGIEPRYIRLLDKHRPNPEVLRLSRQQPEYVKPIWDYLGKMVSPERLRIGRGHRAKLSKFFDALESQYGVPRNILVAIWGMESNYGENLGHFPILQALISLGFDGPRAAFSREQIIAALGILQMGDVAPAMFRGSWAGAMGHTQFIPTTYRDYAVDADGDGQRDIWTSPQDALASAANYLNNVGWQSDLIWGIEVALPANFDYRASEYKERESVAQWRRRGITRADGKRIADALGESWLYLPAGHRGPGFLVTRNFDALLRYNSAPAYALAVSLLAENFTRRRKMSRPWPMTDRPIFMSEIREAQSLLVRAGYDVGGVDGVVGRQTRAAIRDVQQRLGLIADGYLSSGFLMQLRHITQ